MAQERGGLFPRLRPDFPGPISNPKAGKLKRCSFIGADGKRHYHEREMTMFFNKHTVQSMVSK